MRNLYIALICLIPFKIFSQPINVFNTSSDGWTVICEGACLDPVAAWVAINGNPTGCYKSTDNGSGTWYYYGSSDFNTDLSLYYGAFLYFDLKQNTSASQTNDSDVMLVKADGSRIVFNTPTNPGTAWTTYSVPLSEVGWKHTTLGGAAVSSTDFITFLTEINSLRIRGDYSGLTTETTWLDNVYITAIVLLPVELSFFSASQSAINISELNWETHSETNSKYFQIEKSSNGGMSFDSLGIVSTSGTTINMNVYHFYDQQFYTDSYYRLKAVDMDNSVSYSDIIYLKNERSQQNIILYPNPASGVMVLENKMEGITFDLIRITDCYNKTVYQQGASGEQVFSKVEFDINDLINGTYFLSLISEQNITTYVFQVLH